MDVNTLHAKGRQHNKIQDVSSDTHDVKLRNCAVSAIGSSQLGNESRSCPGFPQLKKTVRVKQKSVNAQLVHTVNTS